MLLACLTSLLHAADGSLRFDGAGDQVGLPRFHTLGIASGGTVGFWAKANATAGSGRVSFRPRNP